MTKFLVVTGIDILAECESNEDAQEQAKQLAVATGKFTTVMNQTELQSKIDLWASNDDVRAKSAQNIADAITKSAEHSGDVGSANAELTRGIRQSYSRKYMGGTFDATKIAEAGMALWSSPKHTRVRDGVVTTGFDILKRMKNGAVLTSQPGGRRPSQVEWLLLEHGRLLLSKGHGVKEIIAQVV